MKYLKTTHSGFQYWKFDFVCDSRSNRSWFVHEGKLYFWDSLCPVAEAKIQYYNRTWEAFTYQTLMKRLFFDFLDGMNWDFLEENKDDILKVYEDLSNGWSYYFKVLKKL